MVKNHVPSNSYHLKGSLSAVLLIILLLGGALRFWPQGWDAESVPGGEKRLHFQHTDERTVLSFAQRIQPEYGLWYPDFFGYGSFPFYLLKISSSLLSTVFPQFGEESRAFVYYARGLSAAAGVGCLWITALLGVRMFGAFVGLAAAAALALSPLHIQLSHFFTFDLIMSFFVLLVAYFSLKILQKGGWNNDIYAGLFLGLAVGSKISALPAAALVFAAHFIRGMDSQSGIYRFWKGMDIPGLMVSGTMSLLVFRLVQPYSFLAPPDQLLNMPPLAPWVLPGILLAFVGMGVFGWASKKTIKKAQGRGRALSWMGLSVCALILSGFVCVSLLAPQAMYFYGFTDAVARNLRTAPGTAAPPQFFQYRNTYVFLYQAKQILMWGMGPGVGLVSMLGLFGSFMGCLGQMRSKQIQKPNKDRLLLFSFVLPFCLITGAFFAKFPRYMVPVYPFIILLGFDWFREVLKTMGPQGARWVKIILMGCFGVAVFQAISFMGIYDRELSRIRASRWIYGHVPSGSVISIEERDEQLPLALSGVGNRVYKLQTLRVYEMERLESFRDLVRLLAKTDYLVFASKKNYATLIHMDESHIGFWDGSRVPIPRRPVAASFYKNLFAGNLGFHLAHDPKRFATVPHLGFLRWDDLGADESFSSYDHPRVLIFKNVQRLEAEAIARQVLEVRVLADPWELLAHPPLGPASLLPGEP